MKRWLRLANLALAACLAAGAGASIIMAAVIGAAEISATNPVGWRGDGTGRHVAATPVLKWSATENIRWKVEVGTGQSSPIVVGTRLVVTSEPDQLVCLEAETGRVLWRQAHPLTEISAEAREKGARHSSQYGDATPTAVSDGRWVWVVLGTGMVACHDLTDGQRRWQQWFDVRQSTPYGRTASPLLLNDRLLVHLGPLMGMEAATGKLLWQNDGAKAAYGTPAPIRFGAVDAVVTPRGQVVRIADGKTLASDLGNSLYPSPLVDGNKAYFMDGTLIAVALPTGGAESIEGKELWATELEGEFYASPQLLGNRLYVVDKSANYRVIDTASGKVLLQKKLGLAPATGSGNASVYPSVTLAGKHLFIGNDAGEMAVIETGDEGRVIGVNTLPEGSGATPAFSGRRIYLRGGKHLYCIGSP